MESNWHFHTLLMGMQNGRATHLFGNSKTVSYKVKYTLTVWSCSPTLKYLLNRIENLHLKNLHTNVYCSFSYNRHKLETTQNPSVEGVNKLWYIYSMECYSIIKRNELLTHITLWMNVTCIMLSESSQTQEAAYCMISFIRHFGKDKNCSRKYISGCQKLGLRCRLQRYTREVFAWWKCFISWLLW